MVSLASLRGFFEKYKGFCMVVWDYFWWYGIKVY